jgi:hypothetical protein
VEFRLSQVGMHFAPTTTTVRPFRHHRQMVLTVSPSALRLMVRVAAAHAAPPPEMVGVLCGSQYLRLVQELLSEVVHVAAMNWLVVAQRVTVARPACTVQQSGAMLWHQGKAP